MTPDTAFANRETGADTVFNVAYNNNFIKKAGDTLIFANLFNIIFLSKLAILIGGNTQIFFSSILLILICFYGFLSKTLSIRPMTLVLFLMLTGVLFLTQALCGEYFSMSSIALVLVMHIPYVFMIREGLATENIGLILYRKMMTFVALLGIAQYFLQFVIGPEFTFFMDFYLPPSFHMDGFNALNAVGNDSTTYKSTGVFFLEPAIFCQFLALALIIEILKFKSVLRMLVYIAAIAVTFSGTGLIILFLILPLYLVKQKNYLVLTALVVTVLSAPLWAPMVGLESTIERASEFNSKQSSGYARFLSPFDAIRDDMLPSNQRFAFGLGAGNLPWHSDEERDYLIFNPTWAKIFYEYGTVGAIMYTIFMLYIFTSSSAPSLLKLALLIQFILLGEYLTAPMVHILIVSLLAWPSYRKDPNDDLEETQTVEPPDTKAAATA